MQNKAGHRCSEQNSLHMTLFALGKKYENGVDFYVFLSKRVFLFSLTKYENEKLELVFIETFC